MAFKSHIINIYFKLYCQELPRAVVSPHSLNRFSFHKTPEKGAFFRLSHVLLSIILL